MSYTDPIAFHAEQPAAQAHPAINVKVRRALETSDIPEAEAEAIHEGCVEAFWERATEIAHEHGYAGVFSEGRTGGWLLPFYQGGQKFHQWPGQGPELGYPSYPDVSEREEERRFRKFRTAINALLEATCTNFETRCREFEPESQGMEASP